MTTITYDGTDLYTAVPCLKITGITPTIPGKTKNTVDVPGVDYEYDFGKSKNQNFTIEIEFIILPKVFREETVDGSTTIVTYEETLINSLTNLQNYLDYEVGQDINIDGFFSGKAKVYDEIKTDLNMSKNKLEGTITFECWEEEVV